MDDFEDLNMDELQMFLPIQPQQHPSPGSSDAAYPLSDMEDGLSFLDFNINNSNMASVLATPEHGCGSSDCTDDPLEWDANLSVQSSPSTFKVDDLMTRSTITSRTPFVVAPPVMDHALPLKIPVSSSRSIRSSSSDIPDKTIRRTTRRRLASDAERIERRKESNRKAADKYRQKQKEMDKTAQQNYARVLEENTQLRHEKQSLERNLEDLRSAISFHFLICPNN